jgi:TonB family protein
LGQHGVALAPTPGGALAVGPLLPLTAPGAPLGPRDTGLAQRPGAALSRDAAPILSTRHGFGPGEGGDPPVLAKRPHQEHDVIALDTPRVDGALSQEIIKRVIDAQRAQVRYCYERQLQHLQGLGGRVVLRWIVGATGEVTQVQVLESSLDNAAVEQCLVERIKAWRFPPPAGGGVVEVRYPFVFRAA